MASPTENVEIYRDVIEAWNRRDLVWILDQASADLEFHTAGLFEGIRPRYVGREGMVEFWTTFIEEPWALLRLDVKEIRAVGEDRVLALFVFTGTPRESDEEVRLDYAHLATFADGVVVRIDAFADWDEARRAAASSERPPSG